MISQHALTHRYKFAPNKELTELHDVTSELHIKYNGEVGYIKPATLGYSVSDYKALRSMQKERLKESYWARLKNEARAIIKERELEAVKRELNTIIANDILSILN